MKRRLIINIVLLCLVLLISSFSFSWLVKKTEYTEERLTGLSLAKYFYDGDGSENNPFIITTAKHVYNLIWLQNKNYFTDDHTETGTPVSYYFEIDSSVEVIDFAGEFSDLTGTTGAVPPIGTKDNPFIGYFDGNGCVIKNLWVSTDSNDWYVKPDVFDANADYSYGVGFFGYIERPANDANAKVYAGNFFLENIEVKSTVSHVVGGSDGETPVGLIAGYCDAAMNRIGVDNGIITLDGQHKVSSEYSLIGKISGDATWQDLPGTSGAGDLIIAPSGLKLDPSDQSATYPEFSAVAANAEQAIVPSRTVNGRNVAYYFGGLSKGSPSPPPKSGSFYKYNGETITFSSTTIHINNNTATNINANSSGVDETFLNYCFNTSYRSSNSFSGINPSAAPNFSGVTSSDKYPTNCIWFKPQTSGTCYVAFVRENNNSAKYVSMYRYKRTASGAIDNSTLQELVFSFDNKQLGNGVVVLFELNIDATGANKDYEYIIGKPSNQNQTAQFFFLKLAGTDENGANPASGEASVINQIEFVNLADNRAHFQGFLPVDSEDTYVPDPTVLQFSGTSNNTVLYFDEEYRNSKNVVRYKASNSSITISEKITPDAQSLVATNDYTFTPRTTTK